MKLQGVEGELVVAKAEIRYRSSVSSDISCRASITPQQYEKLGNDFHRNGKARLSLQVDVGEDSNAVLQATYLVIAPASGH